MGCTNRDFAPSMVVTQDRRAISRDAPRLFTGGTLLCGWRLISYALEHRKAGILGKIGISGRALAQQESRSAIRFHPPHEPALGTQAGAISAAHGERPLHAHRISFWRLRVHPTGGRMTSEEARKRPAQASFHGFP